MLNQWQLIVFTFNGSDTSLYLNGTLVASSFFNYSWSARTRKNCYIGKSNWAKNEFSWSYLDELRFYNKSLTQEEILQLMIQNETSKNLKIKGRSN